MAVCIKPRKLTLPATLAALVIGLLLFLAAQEKGILMLLIFFVLSVLATSHKKVFKATVIAKRIHPQTRNVQQVFANGGVAALISILTLLDPPHAALYKIMIAASLASALADTLSSELGMVYGRRFYNILSLKRERNGLDGVVSLEGTVIGFVGACIIALIYAGIGIQMLFVTIGGVMGNLLDSILGACLERKHRIGNNAVNFLNTLFAALIASIFYWLYY